MDTAMLALLLAAASATAAGWSEAPEPIPWNPGWPAPAPAPGLGKGYWLSHGNHRYEIVAGGAGLNVAHVNWRRTDAADPLHKASLLLGPSDATVKCAWLPGATSDRVRVAFNASKRGAVMHLYYMPFITCEYENGACRSGARSSYLNRSSTPTACQAITRDSEAHLVTGSPQHAAAATATYQARDAFQSFDPMGFAMNKSELHAFHAAQAHPKSKVILVAEDRQRPVRGRHFLPSLWTTRGATASAFNGSATPGEHYTWQLVVVAMECDITVEHVSFSDFNTVNDSTWSIPATAFRAMNLRGSDFWGQEFSQASNVSKGEVRSLWMAAMVPTDAPAGLYHGYITVHMSVHTCTVSGTKREERVASVHLMISGKPVQQGGDDDISRGTRLLWLDSKAGLEDSLIKPYTPLLIDQNGSSSAQVRMLGKAMIVQENALLRDVTAGSTSVMSKPMRLELYRNGVLQPLEGWKLHSVSIGTCSAKWVAQAATHDNSIQVEIHLTLDCTGFADYAAFLSQLQPVAEAAESNISGRASSGLSVQLVVPSDPGNSILTIGLGHPGGFLKRDINWKWDGVNGNSGAWIGSTNGGVRCFLKGAGALWQAGDPYDSHISPPVPSDTWQNHGKGGALVHKNGTFVAYTGVIELRQQTLFNWSIMITPVRPLNLTQVFKERWAQLGGPGNYTELASKGVTVVNIHQGNTLNPWINYPFLTSVALRSAAEECQTLGMRYSIYYTIRELSNRCRELHAMLHLNDTQQMIVPGDGGGSDWLQEHLRHDYLAAWSNPIHHTSPALEDAGVRVMAMSRWNNYYSQGILQARREYQAAGLYLDEIAYDRVTMLRAKRLLGAGGIVDHHCHIGAHCGSCAMNYLEHYVGIDRLWYGEGFKYGDVSADYWLAEISGLAFGLSSDMLRYAGTCSAESTYGCAYPYRGMLVGSAHRGPVDDESAFNSPVGTWALWDRFSIHAAEMHGWWEDSSALPVLSLDSSVKVTTYLHTGQRALIVLAWFGTEDEPPPPPPPLRPPTNGNSSARWFCASCPPCHKGSGSFYIKVGGRGASANSTLGWHNSAGDRCCRSTPGECRWYPSQNACETALQSGPLCLPCTTPDRLGCPMGFGPTPAPPVAREAPTHVRLVFNWGALQLDRQKGLNLTAPTIAPFQCYGKEQNSSLPTACKELQAGLPVNTSVVVPLLAPDYSRAIGDRGVILLLE